MEEKIKCDICEKELTQNEIELISMDEFNTCCTDHMGYRNVYNLDLCKAIEGFSQNKYPEKTVGIITAGISKRKKEKETLTERLRSILSDSPLMTIRDQVILDAMDFVNRSN